MEEKNEPENPIEEDDWSSEVSRLLREVEELLAELEDDTTAVNEPEAEPDSAPRETVESPEPAPETEGSPAVPESDSEPPARLP